MSRYFMIPVLGMSLAGCAIQQAPQISADNPASPDAPEAPLPTPSKTLETGEAADMPSIPDAMNAMHHHMDGMGSGIKGMNMHHGADSMPSTTGAQRNGGDE